MLSIVTKTGKIVVGGLLVTEMTAGFVMLFKNNITPNVNSLIGDFTECDFTGYVKQTLGTPGAPYFDPITGQIVVTLGYHQFVTGSPTTIGNTVFGWFATNAGGDLIGAGTFDTPIDMTAPSEAIPLNVSIGL